MGAAMIDDVAVFCYMIGRNGVVAFFRKTRPEVVGFCYKTCVLDYIMTGVVGFCKHTNVQRR